LEAVLEGDSPLDKEEVGEEVKVPVVVSVEDGVPLGVAVEEAVPLPVGEMVEEGVMEPLEVRDSVLVALGDAPTLKLAVGDTVVVVLPVIIGYTVFAYRVFWGKSTQLRY
jgi:hypothetical protein